MLLRRSSLEKTGYGRSSARKVIEDYSLETVNLGMLALLKDLGREKAIWIGIVEAAMLILLL